MSGAGLIAWGLVACAAAALLSTVCKRSAHRLGPPNPRSHDRWRAEPVPILGGAAIYVVTAGLSLLVVPIGETRLGLILAGASLMFIVGLIDDFRPLMPSTKLTAQAAVAGGVAALGIQLRLTDYPLLDAAVTVLWLVGIVNAFNLLDNLDGLAAGVAIIAGTYRLILFLMDGNQAEALAAAIFVGAIVGFLVHNWHPASLFMGDAGSFFLGFYLAGLNLAGDWPYSRGTASVLTVPVLILLLPIFETTWVAMTRRVRRRPIALGGRDHLSHRLVLAGMSERRVVLLLYAIAVASGGLAILSYSFGLSRVGVLVAFAVVALALVGYRLAATLPHPDETAPAEPKPAGVKERA